MSFDFRGKKLLVTGAGRGLGRAIAKDLVGAGGEVYGLDVIKENLDSLVKEFPKVHPICVDLADWDATRREVDKLDPLDGLVNNAAISQKEDCDCLLATRDEIQRLLDVNLMSVVNVSQSVGQKMSMSGRGGSIVNIASLAGMWATPGLLPYSMSKAGVDMATKMFATELGPKKIRVNSVNPSYIQTNDMNAPLMADPQLKKSFEHMTPKEMPTVQETTDLVLYLLSDKSTAITGTMNVIDGGLSCCYVP